MVWLYLAEERNSWRDVVKAVMNLCKICHGTDHEDPEGEWTFSSTLSLTSALDGVGG